MQLLWPASGKKPSPGTYATLRVEMLLLDLRDLLEQVFQLRVVGAGGVAVIFVHAQLLLPFEIFE